MSAGVVVIESSSKPFTFFDGQIKLKLISRPRGRIRPEGVGDDRTAVAEPVSHSGLDARSAVEKPRELCKRDRSSVIEAACRMTFTQERCGRRDCRQMRDRELTQIDLLSGPPRPHRRQGRNEPGIWT